MIYVNGCSMTYGMELGTAGFKMHADELTVDENLYRTTTSWAGIVAATLRLPVTNDAISGASNDRIFRTTIESIESMATPPALVIIGWTSLGRFEVMNTHINCIEQVTFRTSGLNIQSKLGRISTEVVELANFHIKHFVDYQWLARSLVPKAIALESYLEFRKIPYIMFSAIHNKLETANLKFFMPTGFYDSTEHSLHGPYLHPLEDGHRIWADEIIKYGKSALASVFTE